MFQAIFSFIIRSIKTVLQLLVLHTYVAASWYHGSVGTEFLKDEAASWYHGSFGTEFQHSRDTSRQRHTCVIHSLVFSP